jgi:CRP-like cAMP-binding protein
MFMFSDPSLGFFILSLSDRLQRTQDQLQLLSLRTTSKSYVRASLFFGMYEFLT